MASLINELADRGGDSFFFCGNTVCWHGVSSRLSVKQTTCFVFKAVREHFLSAGLDYIAEFRDFVTAGYKKSIVLSNGIVTCLFLETVELRLINPRPNRYIQLVHPQPPRWPVHFGHFAAYAYQSKTF